MNLQAVVFDFDGLIIDSEWVIYETARDAFTVHGHELTVEAWATIVGLGDDDEDASWATLMAAMQIDGFDRAEFSASYAAQDRSNRDSLPLLPGVEVLVDSLAARAWRRGWPRPRRSTGWTATSAASACGRASAR